MSTPVASIVAPPDPLGTLGAPSSVGTEVDVSFVVAPGDSDPGEIVPTVPGLSVSSALGTRAANGTPTWRPCGAELPAPPRDSGSSRVPLSGAGCRRWSLGTGSGSKATPASPPRAPTATVA